MYYVSEFDDIPSPDGRIEDIYDPVGALNADPVFKTLTPEQQAAVIDVFYELKDLFMQPQIVAPSLGVITYTYSAINITEEDLAILKSQYKKFTNGDLPINVHTFVLINEEARRQAQKIHAILLKPDFFKKCLAYNQEKSLLESNAFSPLTKFDPDLPERFIPFSKAPVGNTFYALVEKNLLKRGINLGSITYGSKTTLKVISITRFILTLIHLNYNDFSPIDDFSDQPEA